MFNVEAILSIPLSMVIFVQAIFYVKPIELRIENQAKVIAEDRISDSKNQPIYSLDTSGKISNLKVNPQKVKEILSLACDIKNSLWDESEKD